MLESVFWVVSLQRMKVFSDFLFAVLPANFFKFAACPKQKYTAYDRFYGNGPYGKIPTKKEPIRTRTLGTEGRYSKTNGKMFLRVFCLFCSADILSLKLTSERVLSIRLSR